MTTPTPESAWIEVLLSEEAAFDRLVAHNPRLGKFRRVLNDERVATRLSARDVARMLDLSVDTLLAVVRGRSATTTVPDAAAQDDAAELEDDARMDSAPQQVTLDLRPVFADGHEPLAMILDAIRALPDGAALVIEAPFHPVPLRRLLTGRGYRSSVQPLAPDHWRVSFRREAPAV
jgi:uncharacterized protein (DUF2249 family)